MPEPMRVTDMRHPSPDGRGFEMEMAEGAMAPSSYGAAAAVAAPVREVDAADPATWDRTPRNASCPCGSGKKYKHCHGRG